jgi:diadenosine tetraphosphate (Ap4A) HIT family hydrolase
VNDRQSTCAFCAPDRSRVLHEDTRVYVLEDGFPVSPGHVLIIPRRHVASFFEATRDERDALFGALDVARSLVCEKHRPSGWNIGINDGPAGGQTIPHLHIHLIPRYAGDQPDPRGGVRWIFPGKADYWTNR